MLGLGEIFIVVILGLVLLGPKELFLTLKALGKVIYNLKAFYLEFIKHISKELEHDEFVTIIKDKEGNLQKVYDLEKIKPYCKDAVD